MNRTKAATAYVTTQREKNPGPATWFDVADAYDQGLYHGVEARESAKKAIAEVQEFTNDAGSKHD